MQNIERKFFFQMSNKIINSTIIGLGKIGFRYKKNIYHQNHYSIQKKIKNIKIVSLCDLKKKPNQAPVRIPYYQNYKKMIMDNKNINFVTIATDEKSKFSILKHCVKKKIKKILIEKPLILNKKKFKILKKLFLKLNCDIEVNFQRDEDANLKKVIYFLKKNKIENININYTGDENANLPHAINIFQKFLNFSQIKKLIINKKIFFNKLNLEKSLLEIIFFTKENKISYLHNGKIIIYEKLFEKNFSYKKKIKIIKNNFFYKMQTSKILNFIKRKNNKRQNLRLLNNLFEQSIILKILKNYK